jgi:hypothetical protein
LFAEGSDAGVNPLAQGHDGDAAAFGMLDEPEEAKHSTSLWFFLDNFVVFVSSSPSSGP